MTECSECGKSLFSSNLDRCRECIIKEHREIIEEIVSILSKNELRQLNVINTEVRNRIIKREE